MSQKIKLYDVVKNSYEKDRTKQRDAFKNQGYLYDTSSNDNQQIYYNPDADDAHKLIFSVAGTHNLSDWGTDVYLGMGKLKDTNRYKNAEKALQDAKKRYGVEKATVVGHSLGGAIAQYIGGANDDVYTLDKGATIGQTTRSNEHAYRTSGDVVSLLNSNSTRMKTLKNPNIQTGILPIDAYTAHDVGNIQNEDIFV